MPDQDPNATATGAEGNEEALLQAGDSAVDGQEQVLPVGGESHEAVERVLSPREQINSDIAARRNEDVIGDGSQQGADDDLPVDELLPGQPGYEDQDTGKTVITVNGSEIEVSTADVLAQGIKTLQKESHADQRMEQASTRTKDLDQREKDFNERQDRFRSGLQTDSDIETLGSDFEDALIHDESKAAEILKKLAIDNRELRATTADLVDSNRETQQERANDKATKQESMVAFYHGNFRDVAADPNLNRTFNAEVAKAYQNNPGADFEKVFTDVGTMIREKYIPAHAPKPVKLTPTEIKQGMKRQPKAAGGKVNLQRPPVTKSKTISERIAEARKARGQTV